MVDKWSKGQGQACLLMQIQNIKGEGGWGNVVRKVVTEGSGELIQQMKNSDGKDRVFEIK